MPASGRLDRAALLRNATAADSRGLFRSGCSSHPFGCFADRVGEAWPSLLTAEIPGVGGGSAGSAAGEGGRLSWGSTQSHRAGTVTQLGRHAPHPQGPSLAEAGPQDMHGSLPRLLGAWGEGG